MLCDAAVKPCRCEQGSSSEICIPSLVAGVVWTEMGARLALRRRPVASRREVRAQDELALETARFEMAMRLGDLIKRDPLGDARPDGASRQQLEEPLQVLPELGRVSHLHRIDRVEADMLAAWQPPRQIQARHAHQDGEHPTLRLHARRVAVVPVDNQIRTYWWCSPPRIGRQRIRPARSTARENGASFSKERCVRVPLYNNV
jgi:hypothetical protein